MHRTVSHPPAFLHLLSLSLRWRMVQLLTVGDYKVQELVEAVQQPYNLVSYHLKMLREADLVAPRKSDADGRDFYYSLNLESLQEAYQKAGQLLHPGLVAASTPPESPQIHQNVLFLCTYNSARSQMAEGLLRHLGGDTYSVASAGSHPKTIHPDAVTAMSALGIYIGGQHSKHLSDFLDQQFDTVITVCDHVRETCPSYPNARAMIHWSIPDPAWISDPIERGQAFARTAQELKQRIEFFMQMPEGTLHEQG